MIKLSVFDRKGTEAEKGKVSSVFAEVCGCCDATKDCLRYVQTVCNGGNLLNTADETDRDMVGEYDAIRHNAHEDAITSAAVLNRLADRQGIAPLYTGDITDRHQVADFCLEMTAWLFQNRRRVL